MTLGARASEHPALAGAYEFIRFGCKQAWACVFGALMVALIVATHFAWPPDATIARYDFLFVAALSVQSLLLVTRLETPQEAWVILVYHAIGTAMEVFKTDAGSWIYPEAGALRIGGVPLFSGFMYASVGGYIARCWRLFDFRFTRHPPRWTLGVLALAIYVNFYTHHRFPDLRLALFVASALLLGRTWVHYRIWTAYRRMPLLLGLLLVALFIWFAENIGTLTHTWAYPHQVHAWSRVRIAKLGSWFLLLIVSYALIAALHVPKTMTQAR